MFNPTYGGKYAVTKENIVSNNMPLTIHMGKIYLVIT
jgi:hypothetical protein